VGVTGGGVGHPRVRPVGQRAADWRATRPLLPARHEEGERGGWGGDDKWVPRLSRVQFGWRKEKLCKVILRCLKNLRKNQGARYEDLEKLLFWG
jgi:hypothetical protein